MSTSTEVEKLIHFHKFPLSGIATFGKKIFIPENTENEKETVNNALNKLQEILSADRVEKKKVRSMAEWLPDLKRAKILKKMGQVTQFGYKNGKEHFLLPEEALFLLEMNRLEIFYNGIPLSIEHAYVTLLGNDSCSIKEYRVFQNLAFNGFRVKNAKAKCDDDSNDNSEPVKKMLKIEELKTNENVFNCYNIYSSDSCNKKLTHKLRLQSSHDPLSKENISTGDYSVITSFSGVDSVAYYQLQAINFKKK